MRQVDKSHFHLPFFADRAAADADTTMTIPRIRSTGKTGFLQNDRTKSGGAGARQQNHRLQHVLS
jgi:hypothetical protein